MNNNKFFVTGATGFLGSHVVCALLADGCSVICLIRAGSREKARNRLVAVLENIPGYSPEHEGNLHVIAGNIHKQGLGISNPHDVGRADYFIHCAADVSFSGRDRASVFRTNLQGAVHAIRFAHEHSIQGFIHISTAYVCGTGEGTIPEGPADPEALYNNVYEQSKASAEKELAGYALCHGMDLAILRPSIITGHSITGYFPGQGSIYSFLMPLVRIRNNVDRGMYSSPEFTCGDDGFINMQVSLEGRSNALLNFVPVDMVVRAVSELARTGWDGIYYCHVADSSPLRMGEVVRIISSVLRLKGISLTWPVSGGKQEDGRSGALAVLNELYGPFMRSEAHFATSNLRSLFDGRDIVLDKGHMLTQMIDQVRSRLQGESPSPSCDDRDYIYNYFDVFLKGRIGIPLIGNMVEFSSTFGIDFRDSGIGPRTIRMDRGILVSVSSEGAGGDQEFMYSVTPEAFRDITSSAVSPQECFFRGDADIKGDMKQGLRLASLMEIFFRDTLASGPMRDNAAAGSAGAGR